MFDMAKACEVWGHLQDDESRDIFNVRVEQLLHPSIERISNQLSKYVKKPSLNEITYKKLQSHRGVIIFGCGEAGRKAKNTFLRCGIRVDYFADNYCQGEIDGIKVLQPDEAFEKYPDYLYVPGVIKESNYSSIVFQLLGSGIREEDILLSEYNNITAFDMERQYFDVFEPYSQEVFFDIGMYDGYTFERYKKWAADSYKGGVSFEPSKYWAEKVKRSQRDERWIIENCAVSDFDGSGSFKNNSISSDIAGEVVVVSIDTYCKTHNIVPTYIKMDVEGAELSALRGGKQVIANNKPRMAVCVYHKPEDIFEVPLCLLDMVPDYKFLMRHYSTGDWETVLYAFL